MKVCIKCKLNKDASCYYRLHVTCIKCTKAKKHELTLKGYDCWRDMQKRCTNPNNPSWKYYGGIGRFICPRLSNTFKDFIEVIGIRPTPKHTIDRINNEGNYTCGNCFWCIKNNWPKNIKWSTWLEQSLNKANSNRLQRAIALNNIV